MLQMLKTPVLEEAAKYVDPEKEVATAEEALAGARDILAEFISDNADYRNHIRELTMKKGSARVCGKRSGGRVCL